MADVIVKDSKIHGKGVFAARNFKKGEIVLKWDISHELTKEQLDKMPENEKRYVTFFNGKFVLMQPPERYVNHSCVANTYANNFCDVAKRDIKKGEEITADYAEEGVPDLNMKCKCGSKNCRGVIKSSAITNLQ
jgi:SET domain-containing protein